MPRIDDDDDDDAAAAPTASGVYETTRDGEKVELSSLHWGHGAMAQLL